MDVAFIFDFDGVIADSEPLHFRAFQDVLGPLGLVLYLAARLLKTRSPALISEQ